MLTKSQAAEHTMMFDAVMGYKAERVREITRLKVESDALTHGLSLSSNWDEQHPERLVLMQMRVSDLKDRLDRFIDRMEREVPLEDAILAKIEANLGKATAEMGEPVAAPKPVTAAGRMDPAIGD
jgi:hypothetical protein